MTRLHYWTGWLAIWLLTMVTAYWVIRLAIRHERARDFVSQTTLQTATMRADTDGR